MHVQEILYSERERTVKEAYATGYTGGTGMTSQVASALAAARSADRSQHGPVSADASVRFGRAHFAPSQEGFAAQFGPYAGAPYTAKNHHHLLPLILPPILPCEDRSQHGPALADASARFGRAHFARSQEGFAAQFGPYAGAASLRPYSLVNLCSS